MNRHLRRLFQLWSLWSITLEGELTWWCADDSNHRTRKLDYEVRLPKSPWRAYCWLRRGHEPHYSACIFCGKSMPYRPRREPAVP